MLQHISCLKSACTESDCVKGVDIKKSGKALVSCTMQQRLGGKHIELCGRKELARNGLWFSRHSQLLVNITSTLLPVFITDSL